MLNSSAVYGSITNRTKAGRPEVGYGSTTHVDKSKKMIVVNFMECDLNKIF